MVGIRYAVFSGNGTYPLYRVTWTGSGEDRGSIAQASAYLSVIGHGFGVVLCLCGRFYDLVFAA